MKVLLNRSESAIGFLLHRGVLKIQGFLGEFSLQLVIRFHHEALEGGGFPSGYVQCPAACRGLHRSCGALQEGSLGLGREICNVDGLLGTLRGRRVLSDSVEVKVVDRLALLGLSDKVGSVLRKVVDGFAVMLG